jgi:hypothetical protein
LIHPSANCIKKADGKGKKLNFSFSTLAKRVERLKSTRDAIAALDANVFFPGATLGSRKKEHRQREQHVQDIEMTMKNDAPAPSLSLFAPFFSTLIKYAAQPPISLAHAHSKAQTFSQVLYLSAAAASRSDMPGKDSIHPENARVCGGGKKNGTCCCSGAKLIAS